jgi:hypothetical protein
MLNQAQILLLQKGDHPSGPNRRHRRAGERHSVKFKERVGNRPGSKRVEDEKKK